MLTGRVTSEREAIVLVEVLGPDGQSVHLEAGIDTGYNGFLTLPRSVIEEDVEENGTVCIKPLQSARRVD